ncbi:ABC transporter substrate-binding protein [Sinosporangium siamense]|uniref:Leucine-binding protein domain-containing protein n=1 Tax=Sinosporangium siamense TaxID=1367973 RepID=A0A919RNQ3_9ACTN|nr:ABC transporter substrate-binding protein [Sinosporangium siamense]GII95576.1 hypothetical protein Ssi02_58070 [Sinosporangium siamense]
MEVGAVLSLSGRYARFGTQARFGLEVWRSFNGTVGLVIEDDESDPRGVEIALRRVAARCDILLGPYSTHLMRRAGDVAADLGRLIWNHGGSGDDVQIAHPGHVVSVLTPASRYAEPFLGYLSASGDMSPLWLYRGKGRFAEQVTAGAAAIARSVGIRVVEDEPPPHLESGWNLFCAGSFEEDVDRVRQALALPHPPATLCAVAAGVREFGAAVDRADGVYGVGQWFPGAGHEVQVGVSESDFVRAYVDRVGHLPDYPVVQAAAAATIATHCAQLAGSTERTALWAAATALETPTLFGGFRVDPVTGAQAGHAATLVRWGSGGLAAARPR